MGPVTLKLICFSASLKLKSDIVELLEQQERFFEEKLQSKSKVSRGRLQSVKEFGTTLSEYDSLLTEIEHKTVELKEKFGKLIKIADEFYFTNY